MCHYFHIGHHINTSFHIGNSWVDLNMRNLTLEATGAKIFDFSSQYHHESRCLNLLNRDSSLVWFSNCAEPLPQWVIFHLPLSKDGKEVILKRVGVFLHGENNQNPRHLRIEFSSDGVSFDTVVDSILEYRAGDHIFDCPITPWPSAQYVRFTVLDNHGGSGTYISKCYCYEASPQ